MPFAIVYMVKDPLRETTLIKKREEFSMKKLIVGILTASMIAVLGSTTAFAGRFCHNANAGTCQYNATHTCVDADHDGICDYSGCINDKDGDGVCDYHETAANTFCDQNGDGICDHLQQSNNTYRACHNGGHHGGHCWKN